MSETEPQGPPCPWSPPEPVDAWSCDLFELLSRWPLASNGEWSRWEPGYLLLEITKANGEEIEPILIHTAEEDLTVTLGYWETHLRQSLSAGENDVPDAPTVAEEARQLVTQWLKGELMTAVYLDGNGKWCGSITIEAGDLITQLKKGIKWIKDFGPVRIELRRPRRDEWRAFSIKGDQIEEVAAPNLPERPSS